MRVTEQEVVRIVREHPPDIARRLLRHYFTYEENILVFGWFCFGEDHLKSASPAFHQEILELAAQPGFKAFAAPRGFAKTTTINLTYMSWCIANQQWHFGLIIGDSYTQAAEHVDTLAYAISRSDNFKWLYGNLTTDRWGGGDFRTATGIRVAAKGQGMKLRGLKFRQYRPEFISIDDLENDELVQNPERREKLRDWFRNNVVPAMSKTNRNIVYIGTILHEDSLLNNVMLGEGEFAAWKTRLYKAINTDNHGRETSLWPDYWPLDELIAMRDDPNHLYYVGSITFSQEYQNEPLSDKDSIVKKADVKWIDADKVPTLIRRVMPVDPAISKRETADFTAKGLLGMDREGNVYLTRVGNDHMGFEENVKDIHKWFDEEDPDYIGIESKNFQMAFVDVMKGFPVVELEPDADKRRRFIAQSRWITGGQFYIVRGIPKGEDVVKQLVGFPKAKNDDLVDMVVYGLDMLKGSPIGEFSKHEDRVSDDRHRPHMSGMYGKQF